MSGGNVLDVIEVPFKEYVKDVLNYEWRLTCEEEECDEYRNDSEQTPGVIDHQTAAAIAVKMTSWRKMNLSPKDKHSRYALHKKRPHILDNTADHVYIDHTCSGAETSLCKGLTSSRIPDSEKNFRDRIVDETWTTILKRRDCFTYEDTCHNVFELHYNQNRAGCQLTFHANGKKNPYGYICMPQIGSRDETGSFMLTHEALDDLVREGFPQTLRDTLSPLEKQRFAEEAPFLNAVEGKIGADALTAHRESILSQARPRTWRQLLDRYYDTRDEISPVAYKQVPLQAKRPVEALSTCMAIHYHAAGRHRMFLCLKSHSEEKKEQYVPLYFPEGSGDRAECHEESDACPMGDNYLDIGTKGVVLDIEEKERIDKDTGMHFKDTWLLVKWRVKPGLVLDTDDLELGNDLVGWSLDRDLRPLGDGLSPLVQVRLTGAAITN